MPLNEATSAEHIAAVLGKALSLGATIEIDGLGSFRKIAGAYRFVPCKLARVFVAYVREDALQADHIFDALQAAGFDPWMDRRKLLPGQNWRRAIQNALETCDFAVGCFSTRSIDKRGGFQAEIRYALECARLLPLGQDFLVPVRLDECILPQDVSLSVQYLDLFPDWDAGIAQLTHALHRLLHPRHP